MGTHVCGQCNDEWLTEAEYLAHVCPKTSFKPTQAEHMGDDFILIQQAALVRGLEQLKEDGEDTAAQVEAIEIHAVDNDLTVPAEVNQQ